MDTISCPWISKIFGTSITSAPLFLFYTSCRQRYPINDDLVYIRHDRPCFAALYHPFVRQFVERSWIFNDTRAFRLLSHKKGHLLFLFKCFQIFKKAREFPASRKRGRLLRQRNETAKKKRGKRANLQTNLYTWSEVALWARKTKNPVLGHLIVRLLVYLLPCSPPGKLMIGPYSSSLAPWALLKLELKSFYFLLLFCINFPENVRLLF